MLRQNSEAPESSFDLEDAIILSGMVFGQAYEKALDENEQRKKKRRGED